MLKAKPSGAPRLTDEVEASQGFYCPGFIQPNKQNHRLEKLNRCIQLCHIHFSSIHLSCRFWPSKTAEAQRNGVETKKSRDKSNDCDADVTCDDAFRYL